MGTSTSFGSKKRPAGKQWRSSSSKEIFDNLYKNVDSAFTALEAAVNAGYAPVRSASTGNVANLASFTVANDGVTLVAGDRVLLKNQNTGAQNGIYVVGAVSNGAAPLTRATDMAAAASFTDGDAVWCQEGTANGNKEFRLTTSGVVGTDAISYVTLTTSINAGSITATELAAGSVTGAKVAVLADGATSPQVPVLLSISLADAAGDVDTTLVLPAGQAYKINNIRIEQAGVGNAGNNYTVSKAGSAISNAIAGSTTDGAILGIYTIAAANKANNSFGNGDVLRIAVAKAGGSAAGLAYITLHRTA